MQANDTKVEQRMNIKVKLKVGIFSGGDAVSAFPSCPGIGWRCLIMLS